MTLAEAGEIFRYWTGNPPPHLVLQAIARLLGWRPPVQPAEPDLAELAAAPPPGLAIGAATAGLEPSFDLDVLRDRNRAHATTLARRNGAGSNRVPAKAGTHP
jgi:hypothetical protein